MLGGGVRCQRVVLLIFLVQIVIIVALQDQCAWALGNIAGDSVECRKILHSQGCLPPLVKLLEVQICLVCVPFMLLLYIILYIYVGEWGWGVEGSRLEAWMKSHKSEVAIT